MPETGAEAGIPLDRKECLVCRWTKVFKDTGVLEDCQNTGVFSRLISLGTGDPGIVWSVPLWDILPGDKYSVMVAADGPLPEGYRDQDP